MPFNVKQISAFLASHHTRLFPFYPIAWSGTRALLRHPVPRLLPLTSVTKSVTRYPAPSTYGQVWLWDRFAVPRVHERSLADGAISPCPYYLFCRTMLPATLSITCMSTPGCGWPSQRLLCFDR